MKSFWCFQSSFVCLFVCQFSLSCLVNGATSLVLILLALLAFSLFLVSLNCIHVCMLSSK